ncbi:MAG: histidine-type phosphatase [Eggerthellaceae bacterium]|nr:histidine-type phosphatase [Eggerthellaceae bacterium]
MKRSKHVLPVLAALILALCVIPLLGACAQSGAQNQAMSAAQSQSVSTSSSDTAQTVSASSATSTISSDTAQAASSSQAASSDTPQNTSLDPSQNEQETAAELDFYNPGDAYQLQQVVMLSRHNIRAPLSTTGSALDKATPHTWIEWTSNASELSMRGGALETMMGEYARKWLESEGLIPENYQPEEDTVRFYANSKQRTIATAQYFSSGMLPVANVDIETHVEYDQMDPVFTPATTFISDAYVEAALEQMGTMGGATGMDNVAAGLADSYALIEDVVDYTESEAYKSGELTNLDTTDTQVVLELDKEPAALGSLKTACQLSDALVLQYYESPNATDAAFGHNLDMEQWKQIALTKDIYGDLLFTAPLVAANVAHPLLEEIGSEMDAEGRVFTFLCGHDSNVGSVLAALDAEVYELPNAVEARTPIGCKLVFERWANGSGEQFGRVRLMYQSVDQLREGSMLAGTESPMSVELSFKGLQKNADGLYAYDDLRTRIANATAEYDRIVEEYGEEELAAAA